MAIGDPVTFIASGVAAGARTYWSPGTGEAWAIQQILSSQNHSSTLMQDVDAGIRSGANAFVRFSPDESRNAKSQQLKIVLNSDHDFGIFNGSGSTANVGALGVEVDSDKVKTKDFAATLNVHYDDTVGTGETWQILGWGSQNVIGSVPVKELYVNGGLKRDSDGHRVYAQWYGGYIGRTARMGGIANDDFHVTTYSPGSQRLGYCALLLDSSDDAATEMFENQGLVEVVKTPGTGEVWEMVGFGSPSNGWANNSPNRFPRLKVELKKSGTYLWFTGGGNTYTQNHQHNVITDAESWACINTVGTWYTHMICYRKRAAQFTAQGEVVTVYTANLANNGTFSNVVPTGEEWMIKGLLQNAFSTSWRNLGAQIGYAATESRINVATGSAVHLNRPMYVTYKAGEDVRLSNVYGAAKNTGMQFTKIIESGDDFSGIGRVVSFFDTIAASSYATHVPGTGEAWIIFERGCNKWGGTIPEKGIQAYLDTYDVAVGPGGIARYRNWRDYWYHRRKIGVVVDPSYPLTVRSGTGAETYNSVHGMRVDGYADVRWNAGLAAASFWNISVATGEVMTLTDYAFDNGAWTTTNPDRAPQCRIDILEDGNANAQHLYMGSGLYPTTGIYTAARCDDGYQFEMYNASGAGGRLAALSFITDQG